MRRQPPCFASRPELQSKCAWSNRGKQLAAAAALALTACCPLTAQAEPATATADTLTHPRVITLAPHATEIVYAAGGGDLLVGTVSSSDFPEPARELPRVGDGIILNPERIIMLRPTLLIGWQRSGAAMQIESLAEQLGARMLYSRPQRLRDIPAAVRETGRLLDSEAHALAAAQAMQARIDTLEARYAGRAPVTVFIEVGSKPLYAIGADPLLNDVLRICGAINLYASTGIPAPRVSVESVLVQNPQLIIATERPGGNAQALRQHWAAYGLQAARQGHIHIADPDALYRPGPRLIDATEALCPAVEAVRQAKSVRRISDP